MKSIYSVSEKNWSIELLGWSDSHEIVRSYQLYGSYREKREKKNAHTSPS